MYGNCHSYRGCLGLNTSLVLWGVLAVCMNCCCGGFAEIIDEAGQATAENLEFPLLNPPSPELPPAQNAGGPQRFALRDSARISSASAMRNSKSATTCPLPCSAWNWWHVDTGGPLASGYGIPSTSNSAYPALPGTFYYSLETSPEMDCRVGPVSKVGAYSDVRFRDSGVPMRPFYPNDTCWLQQGYLWALSDYGLFKAGAVTRRFGLDWDGSWWGNTAYFDGFMMAQESGASWEVTPEMSKGFKIDRFLQFFVHNYLDGSLVGADADSVIGSSERYMLVARAVPTLQLSQNETLAVGISGLIGRIENQNQLGLAGLPLSFASPGNQTHSAWAADATYTKGNLKLFAEGLQSYGVLSPSSYISYGPSNRITDALVGVNWTEGAVTYRFCYSLGLDSNPSGTEHLFVPGITVAMTRNTEFYVEYARQEVRHSGTESFTTLENGVQLLLHWHF